MLHDILIIEFYIVKLLLYIFKKTKIKFLQKAKNYSKLSRVCKKNISILFSKDFFLYK